MNLPDHYLILVDPSQAKQQALRRARFNVERRPENDRPKLTVFMAIDHEVHKAMKTPPILWRDPAWFEQTMYMLNEIGLKYELGISWESEWSNAVLSEIKRAKPDQVFIPVYEDEEGNQVLTDETWRLLRSSPVHITLIHPRKDSREERKVILGTVKFQDPSFTENNRKVIEYGKSLAKLYGAQLHLVNVYQDQNNFPDKAKIIEASGLPNNQIHIEVGKVDEMIAKVTKDVKADIALIAPKRRAGIAAALRGATINKIVSKVTCDVMAVV